jgi:hypothetical protein
MTAFTKVVGDELGNQPKYKKGQSPLRSNQPTASIMPPVTPRRTAGEVIGKTIGKTPLKVTLITRKTPLDCILY